AADVVQKGFRTISQVMIARPPTPISAVVIGADDASSVSRSLADTGSGGWRPLRTSSKVARPTACLTLLKNGSATRYMPTTMPTRTTSAAQIQSFPLGQKAPEIPAR